jgi:DNA-binding winged helix-turn-helix (wHTH) protein/Tol biopolymer transport system component
VATSSSSPLVARFGLFQVELNSGRLSRSGERVPIQEQPLQVLRLLLEADGRVVTRDQLRAALWPKDTFVDFEHGVNTAVKKLRQALGDSAENPKFIETLPRVGYRFMASVEWVDDAGSRHGLHSVVAIGPPRPVPHPIALTHKWKLTSAIAVAIMVITALIVSATNETSYLSSTRWGASLRQAVVSSHAGPQLAMRQRRLTANPNDAPVTGAVISPDGKYLAYSDPTGLYLRQVDEGETFAVPLPKGFVALPESWFPDSIHLAVRRQDFSKTKLPSLWKISVMGGVPQKLADEGAHARVSPDGSRIAFLTRQEGHDAVWVIDAATNTTTTAVDGGEDHLGPVAWAPDGKRFVYVRFRKHVPVRIEMCDPASGNAEIILSNPLLGGALAWVTPTRLIYSLRERQTTHDDDDFNLWALPIDYHTGHATGSPSRMTQDHGSTVGLSATSDGKRIVLLRRTSQADVYLSDIEVPGKQVTKPRRFTLDERQDFPFGWTPDSKAVFFLSDREGPLHIFKQGIDQTQPELLVGGNERMWVPRLTPNNDSVLYLVNSMPNENSDQSRIMRVPLTGGLSTLVLRAPHIYNHQCAKLPSTLCIYSQIEPGLQRFFTYDPEAGSGTEIAAATMNLQDAPGYNWSLSSDGKYLASAAWTGQNKQFALRIVDLATGTAKIIPVAGPSGEVGTDWAADNKSVWLGGYLRRGPWGYTGVLNVGLNGTVTPVLDEPNLSIWAAIPSPDGRHLALVGHTEDSNAWLLENF